jgi:predicted RNA-binding Zn-ribbon protein involved in translation (DUF1610 family)
MELKIIELYNKGLNCTDIAKKLGIHRTTVSKILKNNDIDVKRKFKTTNINCNICKKNITNNKGNRSRCQPCNTNIRRYRVKKMAVDYLGGECKKCGWSGDISGYDFHHKNRNKDFGLTGVNLANRKWVEVREELDKCELLCALCHRLEHSNYTNVDFLKEADNYDFTLFKE